MEWPRRWDRYARGRRIAVAYDAGSYERCVERAEALLAAGAKEAWPVDLGATGLEHGEDLGDWFVKYGRTAGELRDVITDARDDWRAG
jgi:hypothetical protein